MEHPAANGGACEHVEEDIMIADGDDDFGDEEEICVVDNGDGQSEETNKFDLIVGALEDYLMDAEFEELRTGFCRRNCHHFEAAAENKLIYTDLFQQYTTIIEQAIERQLQCVIPGFELQAFFTMLQDRQEELQESEVFDLLLSMAEFDAFKELMLSYAEEMAGNNKFEISVTHMPIHLEEQEDGDERPDLDFGLSVSVVGPSRHN